MPAQRLVYGVVTAEKPDVTGEVCDYASTKPQYQKWSQNFASATEGKSLGNLRAMHGHVAAGKLIEIAFNDEQKRIEICGKVVDDAEWQKVEEGVYTGFSQGGRYLKRWADPDEPALMRYGAPRPASRLCPPRRALIMYRLQHRSGPGRATTA
jgi:hypothetical protein